VLKEGYFPDMYYTYPKRVKNEVVDTFIAGSGVEQRSTQDEEHE